MIQCSDYVPSLRIFDPQYLYSNFNSFGSHQVPCLLNILAWKLRNKHENHPRIDPTLITYHLILFFGTTVLSSPHVNPQGFADWVSGKICRNLYLYDGFLQLCLETNPLKFGSPGAPDQGDVSDRYLFSGPVSSQASPLSLAPDVSPESPVLQPFCLIPLKPGWVSLPKVQVLWANQDASSWDGFAPKMWELRF